MSLARWLVRLQGSPPRPAGEEGLSQAIETVVPYVAATLDVGGTMDSDDPDWVKVHRGRAKSSVRQLEALLAFARGEFK